MDGSGSEVSLVREYPRAWAEMDPDVLGLIFNSLSLEEKLEVIPWVCKPWRHAAEGFYSWKSEMEKIDIDGLITIHKNKKLDCMLRMLVTMSSEESLSSADHPGLEDGKEFRAWAEMDPDALELIFNKLSFEEKLQVIPMVCKPWRYAADKSNYPWESPRRRDMRKKQFQVLLNDHLKKLSLMLLRVLVTRNTGSFHELYVSWIGDTQLSFIAHHARSLRVLSVRASSITDSMVEQVAPELTSLTAIDLSHCKAITARSIAAIGTSCSSLESLTLDMRKKWCPDCQFLNASVHNDMGRAISLTMPKLKRLSIANDNIIHEVAHQILSGCPALEWLKIKGCWRRYFKSGVLEGKYSKIQVVLEDPYDEYDGWEGTACGRNCILYDRVRDVYPLSFNDY